MFNIEDCVIVVNGQCKGFFDMYWHVSLMSVWLQGLWDINQCVIRVINFCITKSTITFA